MSVEKTKPIKLTGRGLWWNICFVLLFKKTEQHQSQEVCPQWEIGHLGKTDGLLFTHRPFIFQSKNS